MLMIDPLLNQPFDKPLEATVLLLLLCLFDFY